jgi:hypothetical protein
MYDLALKDRLESASREFERWHLLKCVTQRGLVQSEDLLKKVPFGCTSDEMEPVASTLLDRVEAAYVAILRQYPSAQPPMRLDGLRAKGVQIDPAEETVFREVVEQLWQERASPQQMGIMGGHFVAKAVVGGAAAYLTVHPMFLKREQETRDQLGALVAQITLVTEEISRTGTPPGIWRAFGVLGYFAAAGAAFPLAVLAFDPQNNGTWLRTLAFVFFITGLIGLIGYMASVARSLVCRDPSVHTSVIPSATQTATQPPETPWIRRHVPTWWPREK